MVATVEMLGAVTVLVLAVALMLARSPEAAVLILAWASVPQAAIAAALAGWSGMPVLFADAAAILVVKGFWAPRVLGGGIRHQGEVYGYRAAFSSAVLLVGTGAVTLICLRVGTAILPVSGPALGFGLAAMFTGFWTAAIRSELWSQAAGMLMGEAGLMTAALVLSAGLPPVGEILALAEVVLLATILAGMTRLVKATFGSADSGLLRGLRG